MRESVYKIYLQYLQQGFEILELNAGTGRDAVRLVREGLKVHATDFSEGMYNEIVRKIQVNNLTGKLSAGLLSFSEIKKITDKKFDGVISNFGGLNCINSHSDICESLSEVLKPGGIFIAVVLNKFCPWEIFHYSIRFDFKNAFRRFGKAGTDANLCGLKVRTFYFSPRKFFRDFEKHFKLKAVYSLALFTPPPYLVSLYRRINFFVRALMFLDEKTNNIYPFNRFGDHFIAVMYKREQK